MNPSGLGQTQGRVRREEGGEETDVMRRAGARADEKNMITVSFVDGSNHSEGISVPRIGAAADLTTRSCSSLLDDDEALPTWSGMAHPSSGTVQNVNADCIMYSLPNPSRTMYLNSWNEIFRWLC